MTHDTFIPIWGTKAAFARAIGESEITVRHWFNRGSIPAKYDAAIIAAASEAGHVVTPADLFDLRQSLIAERAQKRGAA